MATFSLKYSAGNYVIKYAVDKLSGSNTFTVKNKITLTVLKWGIKGDVSKIKLIKNKGVNKICQIFVQIVEINILLEICFV